MSISAQQIQQLVAAMQKQPALADAGVVVIDHGVPAIVRSPNPLTSSTFVVLSELTPQKVTWPDATWLGITKRQLSTIGVDLPNLASAGVVGNYASLVGSAARPTVAGAGDAQDALSMLTRQMQETAMSFNLQYLTLQSQMQSENRKFTTLSNVMKTRHDTAKNAINNIR